MVNCKVEFPTVLMKYFIAPLLFFMVLQLSCKPETECDTASYALPEISLLYPEDTDITVTADTPVAFKFFFRAEAGLNTFSMNGQPMHVFTNGETEAEFEFSTYFWESGNLEFLLYDLCNQSSSITLNMTVIQPSS